MEVDDETEEGRIKKFRTFYFTPGSAYSVDKRVQSTEGILIEFIMLNINTKRTVV